MHGYLVGKQIFFTFEARISDFFIYPPKQSKMKSFKKLAAVFVVLMSVAILLMPSCSKSDEDPMEVIVIGTASPGGVYFPLGMGIAKVITDNVEDVFARSETTGGSVDNCQMLGAGSLDLGMAMANVALDAYEGVGSFAGDAQPVLAVFSMYPSVQHIIVRADSDIFAVEDLAGTTVSIDAAGSGGEVVSLIILEAAGILDEVNTLNYQQLDAASALIDGDLDAVFYNLPYPSQAVEKITGAIDVRFIPVSQVLFDDIYASHPYFTFGEIPEEVYGLDEGVPSIMVGNLMLAHPDMDDDLVYDILTAIFLEASIEELLGVHPVANFFEVDMASETIIPMHPGAERFFSAD